MDMNQVLGFLKTYWYVVALFLACFVYMIVMNVVVRKKSAKFKQDHADAVKVYLTGNGVGVMSESVRVCSVDSRKPAKFADGMKSGFYLLPGSHEVEMEFSHTRAGIMYKTVTTSTGVVRKKLTVEESKSYMLTYDRKNKEFMFEEL